ncbi:MAG: amidohydrolase family protein [Sandaracinaceae bacterium]|nr:amidohydrolase family protein [Sandaracinaceae bacterium]
MKLVVPALTLTLAACSSAPPRIASADGDPRVAADDATPTCLRVVGARAPGGEPLELAVRDGRLVRDMDCEATLDADGRFAVPAFIDSHVHLAYLPRGPQLAAGGVAAAVDLASPIAFLETDPAPLRLVRAGPMIGAPDGYPTTSWGRDGYGVACTDAASCRDAVDRAITAGAGVIKISLGAGPDLDDASIAAIVERAHDAGVRVAVHALGDADAARAARLGADVLAHTPTAPLEPATIDAWSSRAVVSTLGAFGGGVGAIENLRRLREAGATVLYGTDLGNTSTASIDGRELALLEQAGLDGAAILAAATSAPAAFWGLDDLGALEPGRAASFLLLDADPLEDPSTLTAPAVVVLDGHRLE